MTDKPTRELLAEPCRSTLQRTLDRLERGLKGLDKEGASAEQLHDLRVAIRRTESALFLCQPWLHKGSRRWLEDKCEQLRRASNAVRDCDVILKWIEDYEPAHQRVSKVERQREDAVDQLLPIVARLAAGRKFNRHRRRLFQAKRFNGIGVLAAQLMKLNGTFTELAGEAQLDPERLHRWRITGKKLRYAFEFLAELGCSSETKDALAALEELQDQLGAATDAANRSKMLGQSSGDDTAVELENCCDIHSALQWLQRSWDGTLAAAKWCASGT